MSEQMFNTRIIHKHDTEENWDKVSNFIPKNGELIIYDVDENYGYSRVKIGDGTTNIKSIPFITDTIELDVTLTQGDTAADAKAVGDAIRALEQQVGDLLYKVITIPSFALNSVTVISSGKTSTTKSPVELGSTVTSVTLGWSLSKDAETLKLDGTSIDKTLTSYTYSNLNLTNNKTYKLEATDERQGKASKTVTLTFCNRVCYGVAEMPNTINSDFVMSLPTKNLTTSKANSGVRYSASGNQYLWYCVPSRLGECSFIDTETGLGAGMALVDTINVTNASGYTEQYYVYRSDYAGLGDLTIKVT